MVDAFRTEVAREFPGTRAAKRAEQERRRLIIAELETDGSVEAHLRELSAPSTAVVDHIEAFAARLEETSVNGQTLARFALRLSEFRPRSRAVDNLVALADEACFRAASAADKVAGWDAYLNRFGARTTGIDERVATPHQRTVMAPVAGDYIVDVSAVTDVDLEVTVDGRAVCKRTSSDEKERCQLSQVRAGAEMGISIRGSREARLQVRTDATSWPNTDALGGKGRFLDRAKAGRDISRGREILGLKDPRQAAAQLGQLLESSAPMARGDLTAMLATAREKGRQLAAREAIDDSGVWRGFDFLRTYPEAPERASVATAIAKRLEATVDDANNVDDYDTFLTLETSGQLNQAVRTARGRVAARLAAEERMRAIEAAREEAEARREAAREEAEERRSPLRQVPSSVEGRVACLRSRCDGCTDTEILYTRFGGSVEVCLQAFKVCATRCGCYNFGPHVSSLEQVCR